MIYELPEVETVRRDLERDLIGKKIKSAEAASMRCLRRYHNRRSFTSRLVGAKISRVSRIGLHIVIGLDNGLLLLAWLGSSGSLRRNVNKDAKLPGTEVVIQFTQHGQLRFVDTEGTGELFLIENNDSELDNALPERASHGIDPVAEPILWTEFAQKLLSRKAKLKALLTDDSFVVGIGNIYADEILFNAGLRHDRITNTLSSQEIRRLHRALVGILHDALKYRGTSVPGRAFVDPAGQAGKYHIHLEVWGRNGKLSSRSRTPIKRIKFQRTWTYYCDTQV